VRFNGLEFTKLKDANEYLRTVTLDSTTQLTVNGLDFPSPLATPSSRMDDLGTMTRTSAAFATIWPESGSMFAFGSSTWVCLQPIPAHVRTAARRRPASNILETEATIQGNEAKRLARLHTAWTMESPYEAKVKEYEQRLAEIDKNCLARQTEVEELVGLPED